MNNHPSSYLELMKICLTDYHPSNKEEFYPLKHLRQTWKIRLLNQLDKILKTRNFALFKVKEIIPDIRRNGYDWPANAYTMIGVNRLTNIEHCIRTIISQHTIGDFVETGVWRGGAVIFMKAALRELGHNDRKIWAIDSYEGLPKPDDKYPADVENKLYQENILSVSAEEVQNNFKRFGLLDSSIIILKGLFKDTLPIAPIENIALLRLDCDMYESTITTLNYLYHKVAINGFIIVDDYNSFNECKMAVEDFRQKHSITDPIIEIDQEAIYWQKSTH